jgi:hypothetical protein
VNTFETQNPKTIYTIDHGEKNLTIGSSKLVDSVFVISANGSSRCVDARASDTRNPKTPKGSMLLIQGGDPTIGFHAWIGRGHMNAYHVPVSRGDRREWWDPMMSLKATWNLLNVPHAMVVKDDNSTMGWENKVTHNFRNS